MPAAVPRQEIADAIGAVLSAEAQRNEVRVSLVRLFAYALVAGLDGALMLAGLRTPANLLATASVAAVSFGLLQLLRAGYRPWFRFAIPLLDAAFIGAILHSRIEARGLTRGLAATTAVACALFAATGGLRFDRASAAWTTAVAATLLVVLVRGELDGASQLYVVVAIAAIGFLAIWTTDLVRRAMEGARGRALLLRFLPRGLVDRAFRDPLSVLAEPREVEATVLVSDLRGFTRYAEKLPPGEVLAFLNEVQGELAAAVQSHGGVVDKFMGDGMLAVFGAPEPLPDHAARAIAAAREIRTRIERVRQRRGEAIGVGIGIHTGRLVAGCLGSGDRLEFTVIGDTVNIASRLESLTKERGVDVLVSEETARVAGEAALGAPGEVAIRGRTEPLRIRALA